MKYVIASIVFFVLSIGLLLGVVDVELDRAKRSHAEWVANCLTWINLGCDAEAGLALEQLMELREHIQFLRKFSVSEWVRRIRAR